MIMKYKTLPRCSHYLPHHRSSLETDTGGPVNTLLFPWSSPRSFPSSLLLLIARLISSLTFFGRLLLNSLAPPRSSLHPLLRQNIHCHHAPPRTPDHLELWRGRARRGQDRPSTSSHGRSREGCHAQRRSNVGRSQKGSFVRQRHGKRRRGGGGGAPPPPPPPPPPAARCALLRRATLVSTLRPSGYTFSTLPAVAFSTALRAFQLNFSWRRLTRLAKYSPEWHQRATPMGR